MNRHDRRAAAASLGVVPSKRQRVMLAIPSMDVWKSKFGTAFGALCAYSARFADLFIVNEECSLITQARNKLARGALERGVDWMLTLDADMVFPPDGLERLIKHDKDIVCGFYNKRCPPYTTVGRLRDNSIDVGRGGLHEAVAAGGGFMLVRTSVFRRVPPPWFFESFHPDRCTEENPDGHKGEDYNFLDKCAEYGIKAWCDLDLSFELGHTGDQVVRCNRPQPRQMSSAS